MRPEYIAIQAAVIRGLAKQEGFTFPELALPDAELVRFFQDIARRSQDKQPEGKEFK